MIVSVRHKSGCESLLRVSEKNLSPFIDGTLSQVILLHCCAKDGAGREGGTQGERWGQKGGKEERILFRFSKNHTSSGGEGGAAKKKALFLFSLFLFLLNTINVRYVAWCVAEEGVRKSVIK